MVQEKLELVTALEDQQSTYVVRFTFYSVASEISDLQMQSLLRRSQSQFFLSLSRNLSYLLILSLPELEFAQKFSKYQIGVFFDA
jgi:hypothetical protein